MHDYKEKFASFKKSKDWKTTYHELNDLPKKDFKNAQISEWINEAKNQIQGGSRPKIQACGRTLLVLLGSSKAIQTAKKSGLLRLSQYKFQGNGLAHLIDDWIANSNEYQFNKPDLEYLRSVKELTSLSSDLRTTYVGILNSLRAKKQWAPKTFLSEAALHFFTGHSPRTMSFGLNPLLIREEVIEGTSYLLQIFYENFGLTEDTFSYFPSKVGYTSDYLELINQAVILCQYRETEIRVETFNYRVRRRGTHVFVSASLPNLEKSIRIGYLKYTTQFFLHVENLINKKEKFSGSSLEHLSGKIWDKLSTEFIRFLQFPHRRYATIFPMTEEMKALFSSEKIFIEERSFLDFMSKEDYVDASTIVHAPIKGSIRVIDILKIQRLYFFVLHGLSRAISQHQPAYERDQVFLASILPNFQREELIKLMKMVVGEKAEELLQLLSCNFSKGYVDLQYTPLIPFSHHVILPLGIFSGSNLVRNLLCHHSTRLTLRDGKNDPMQKKLKMAFEEAGFLVSEEVDTGSKDDKKEVDLLAYRDGHLFVIECKNTYHPCNAYELRTAYSHITTAANQLDIRKNWLQNLEVQKRVYEKCGWTSAIPTSNVHTCIALGTRVFNGHSMREHPVRHVHEFINVLTEGYVRMNHKPFRFWADEKFSTNDLLQYLGDQGVAADIFDACIPTREIHPIGQSNLVLNMFRVEPQELKEIFTARYSSSPDLDIETIEN